MPRIFVSYRHAESQNITDHICEHMKIHFGDENVIQDVETFPLGLDFRQSIGNAVDMCDALLVIIGPKWLTVTDSKTGQPRLANPDDFVRIEIESALKRDILIHPSGCVFFYISRHKTFRD